MTYDLWTRWKSINEGKNKNDLWPKSESTKEGNNKNDLWPMNYIKINNEDKNKNDLWPMNKKSKSTKEGQKKIYLPVKVSNPLLLHVFLSMPHDIVSHWVSLANTLTFRVPVIKSTPTQHSIPWQSLVNLQPGKEDTGNGTLLQPKETITTNKTVN